MDIINLLCSNEKTIHKALLGNNSLIDLNSLKELNFLNLNFESENKNTKDDIYCIIYDSYEKVSHYFESINIKFFILPLINDLFYEVNMNGIVAHTDGLSSIYLYLSTKNLITKDKLESIVIHELQHVLRNSLSNNTKKNLLDVLIDEGTSEFFVESVLGKRYLGDWVEELKEEQIYDSLQLLESLLSSCEVNEIQKIMFGNSENIPLWFGYKLGYSIVKKYITENPQDIIEFIKKDAFEIYEYTLLKG